MNTAELREWLREELADWEAQTERVRDEDDFATFQFCKGYTSALRTVNSRLRDLTSLDSSHDLPSTKG